MFKVHFSLFFPLTCSIRKSLSQLLTKTSHGDKSVKYESDYLALEGVLAVGADAQHSHTEQGAASRAGLGLNCV